MKKIICLVLALVMVVALCACGNNTTAPAATAAPAASEAPAESEAPAADSDLAYIQANGKLIVGITDFEPMDYKDANGEWIGFDADMAKAFAEYIGVEAEFIEIDWDNKLLELNAKSIDCVWNGMTLTNEVTNTMACGDAYYINAQVIVVKKDVADKFADGQSLKDVTVAVEAGSAGEIAVKDLGFEPMAVSTQAAALMEVAAGTSDACVIDLSMANAMIGEGTNYPDLVYTAKLNSEEYGVGFRQGGDMAAKFNEFYAKACADGTVAQCAETYGISEFVITK